MQPCLFTFPFNSLNYYIHIFFKLQFGFLSQNCPESPVFCGLLISCGHCRIMSTTYGNFLFVNFLLTFQNPAKKRRIHISFQQNSPQDHRQEQDAPQTVLHRLSPKKTASSHHLTGHTADYRKHADRRRHVDQILGKKCCQEQEHPTDSILKQRNPEEGSAEKSIHQKFRDHQRRSKRCRTDHLKRRHTRQPSRKKVKKILLLIPQSRTGGFQRKKLQLCHILSAVLIGQIRKYGSNHKPSCKQKEEKSPVWENFTPDKLFHRTPPPFSSGLRSKRGDSPHNYHSFQYMTEKAKKEAGGCRLLSTASDSTFMPAGLTSRIQLRGSHELHLL